MKKNILSLLIFSTLTTSTFARDLKNQPVNKIQDLLSEQVSEIAGLGAKIRTIEQNLGKNHEDYLRKSKEVKNLEQMVANLRETLSANSQKIDQSRASSEKLLQHYLLEVVDENSEDQLLKKKVYIKLIENKISELDQASKSSSEILVTLNDYEKRLETIKEDESSLYNLIVDLENQKKHLGERYVYVMENKTKYEEYLEEAIARQKASKKTAAPSVADINIKLRKPLDTYVNFKASDKGVTYLFNSVTPVFATGSGKVVYSGELASYGKVIMIDHGDEIRTVLLGDMNIKVNKGDSVNNGDVLAYTNSDPGLNKSLYFEVRKKNIAQNTLNILKKNNTNI
jgi:murein DD-endopeptidase MepM/ murein hydrolase activator NlpD